MFLTYSLAKCRTGHLAHTVTLCLSFSHLSYHFWYDLSNMWTEIDTHRWHRYAEFRGILGNHPQVMVGSHWTSANPLCQFPGFWWSNCCNSRGRPKSKHHHHLCFCVLGVSHLQICFKHGSQIVCVSILVASLTPHGGPPAPCPLPAHVRLGNWDAGVYAAAKEVAKICCFFHLVVFLGWISTCGKMLDSKPLKCGILNILHAWHRSWLR